MLLQLHQNHPAERDVRHICQLLNDDAVVVFPTDSVYALGCSIDSRKGFERLCRIRKIDPSKALFSIIVADLSQASEYHAQLTNAQFRVLKKNLPGPFTFILGAGRGLPAHLRSGRKTIGVRIPANTVIQTIVARLGKPLITTSLRSDDEILEYFNEPEEIYAELSNLVDCVIDAGPGSYHPSTIVELLTDEPVVLREGKGDLSL